jgi:hypothetical protein
MFLKLIFLYKQYNLKQYTGKLQNQNVSFNLKKIKYLPEKN